MEKIKLDQKDYKILKELDINYRTPFSKIAKRVKLSKNSVINRYEKKLKKIISHASTGIHYERLGYKLVKVYYAFRYYDEKVEKKIIKELKNHHNIIWAAKYYGPFDISIALLVKDLNQLMIHINEFNEDFSDEIDTKKIELIEKQFFARHDYIHKSPTNKIHIQENYKDKPIKLNKTDKKIISAILNDPRKTIIKISIETKLNPKTVTTRIRELEKQKIITGYFPTLENNILQYNTFKLLIIVNSGKDTNNFEEHLKTIKNIKHFRKMIGYWDYEIDMMYQTNDELHKKIEELRNTFPKIFKKIHIATFEKRIITNKEPFLLDD